MKKILLLSIIVSLFTMSNCSTPYKNLAKFKHLDDMEYRHEVKKAHLPESGYNIAYTDEGSGKQTIIFIHGLGSYLQAWIKNVDHLKTDYRCISIDLPGYGKSSKQPHSGQMTFYAGIVNEFVRELGLSNVIIAGHSMGGQIAITAALQYPNIVEGLILVAPAGFEKFHKGQKQWFREAMTLDGVKLTTPEAIQNNLASNFYRLPDDAYFMITDRISMRSADDFDAYCYAIVQSVQGMVDNPVLNYLQDIKVPTLILFGENDNLIPNRFLNPGPTTEVARYGASKIKDSKLVMVPKCGHFLMFEKSEVFNSEVKAFFN
ncbi:MAG: alpha/beta hydrolase [Bacteroidales bacterium]|nr:alpha/beta hydrolase [Bacteroidales bacterium]MDD4672628.1 alpha/beta hydrolase [Bacteroidales bacterium]